MSDDEKFLSRWSQRKREAVKSDSVVVVPETLATEPDVSATAADNEAEEAFDLSTLPKLEDITDTSDITGFLKKGVPESLRNAALRKSWALDPAIRNYVNPALEYAYDWNTPGGVPGTSELAIGTDIVGMVSQIMGSGDSRAEAESSEPQPDRESDNPPEMPSENVAAQIASTDLDEAAVRLSQNPQIISEVLTESKAEPAEIDFTAPQQAVRRHGTAKPRV